MAVPELLTQGRLCGAKAIQLFVLAGHEPLDQGFTCLEVLLPLLELGLLPAEGRQLYVEAPLLGVLRTVERLILLQEDDGV